MNKAFIFACLAVSILAGAATRSNRIALESGRRNNLDFACGVVDPKTGAATPNSEPYTYIFAGLPAWLAAKGSTLSGTPPKGSSGSYAISVNYRSQGGKTGVSNVLLTVGNTQDVFTSVSGNTTTVTYISGAAYKAQVVIPSSNGNYVVFVPIKTGASYGVSTVTVSPAPVPAAVSCASEENNVTLANAGVASTQTALDKNAADTKSILSEIADLNNKLAGLNSQIAAAVAQSANTDNQINAANGNVNNLTGSLNDAQNANGNAKNALNNAVNGQQAAQNAANDAAAKKNAADNALNAANQAADAANAALTKAQNAVAQAKNAASDAQNTANQAAQTQSNDQAAATAASQKVADLRAQLAAAIADETAANNKLSSSTAAQNAANDALKAAQDAANQAQTNADQSQNNANNAKNQQNQAQNDSNDAATNVQNANNALTNAQNQAKAAQDASTAAENAALAAQQALANAKVNLANLQNQKITQANNLGNLQGNLASTQAAVNKGNAQLAALNDQRTQLQGQLAQALSNAGLANQALVLCKARQTERDSIAARPGVLVNVENDNSCGRSVSSSIVRGQGKITNIGAGTITIDNTTTISIGECTNVIHSNGRYRPLRISDRIIYDAIPNGGRNWASAISCSGWFTHQDLLLRTLFALELHFITINYYIIMLRVESVDNENLELPK